MSDSTVFEVSAQGKGVYLTDSPKAMTVTSAATRRQALFLITGSHISIHAVKKTAVSFTSVPRAAGRKFLLQFSVKKASKEFYVR
jgi:hypothetical protein